MTLLPSKTPTPEQLDTDAFLKEYEALCYKHGAIIDSCGCCGSPWPQLVSKKLIADHIQHLLGED